MLDRVNPAGGDGGDRGVAHGGEPGVTFSSNDAEDQFARCRLVL